MTTKADIDREIGAALRKMAKPLEPGDIPAEIDLHDTEGRPFKSNADYLSGRPLVLMFAPAALSEAAAAELGRFQESEEQFRALGVNVVLLSLEADNDALRATQRRLGFPWPAVSDPTGRVFAQYGMVKDEDIPGAIDLRTVVTTPYRRVSAIHDAPAVSDHATRCEEHIRRIGALEEGFAAPHPPVLVIPGAFARPECEQLVAYYERESHPIDFDRNNPQHKDTDIKQPMWDHNRQDRIDLAIKHPMTTASIDQRLFQRITPIVKRAFAFEVTRRESLFIARYEGARSGIQMGHRDNVLPHVAHRRFALSVILNEDFEGGELVFPEFSNHGYRGATGTALVFSSSLLHEVRETTKGRRYALISHLYSHVPQQ